MFELKENHFDRINSASPMREQAPDPEDQFTPHTNPDPQIKNFKAKDPNPSPVNHSPNSHKKNSQEITMHDRHRTPTRSKKPDRTENSVLLKKTPDQSLLRRAIGWAPWVLLAFFIILLLRSKWWHTIIANGLSKFIHWAETLLSQNYPEFLLFFFTGHI